MPLKEINTHQYVWKNKLPSLSSWESSEPRHFLVLFFEKNEKTVQEAGLTGGH